MNCHPWFTPRKFHYVKIKGESSFTVYMVWNFLFKIMGKFSPAMYRKKVLQRHMAKINYLIYGCGTFVSLKCSVEWLSLHPLLWNSSSNLYFGDPSVGHVQALKSAGLDCNYVTGGGTGTYLFEAASQVFTEVQPVSFPFWSVAG